MNSGQRVGNYILQEKVGEGAFAEVRHKVRDAHAFVGREHIRFQKRDRKLALRYARLKHYFESRIGEWQLNDIKSESSL